MDRIPIGAGTIGIGSSPQWLPSQDGASVALEVEDFDAAVASLREHNVPIIVGPMEMPTCHMATVRDPDGTRWHSTSARLPEALHHLHVI